MPETSQSIMFGIRMGPCRPCQGVPSVSTSDVSRLLVIQTRLFFYTATTAIKQVDLQCSRQDAPIIKEVAIDIRDKVVVSGM
jgi:hypothetical protein